jgi:stage II sporulation protein D
VGAIQILNGGKIPNGSFRGRLSIEQTGVSRAIRASSNQFAGIAVALPCTLMSSDEYNFIEVGEESYRGAIILLADANGGISIVNYLDVEEYLRGVVPMELGTIADSELEAAKAQSIAARTYAYKRIEQRVSEAFDLLSSVSDQVYGGVRAESRWGDAAVRMTSNLVAVYADSLIGAYYHSTCGGATANIEDVWEKPPAAYLRSVKDTGANGAAYCFTSRYFAWQESWKTPQLASIITRFSPAAGNACGGNIKRINVISRTPCGRVAACEIQTSMGDATFRGDKIRFVLRRQTQGFPILRSANFRIVSGNSHYVQIDGTGYGHGVGMCQMGAIGRARAGHTFEQILQAYYTGISIRTARAAPIAPAPPR